jgi:hypothetical protein
MELCAGFASDAGWEATCEQAGPQCAACEECKKLALD